MTETIEPVSKQEIIDFLYKHGDLTYSAAARAINLLAGNGYSFTSGNVKHFMKSQEELHIAEAFAKSVYQRGAAIGDENARQLIEICSAALASGGNTDG